MDHRFQINLRGIIELLSKHLYSSPQVYLRELLQNGVDAITARRALEPEHAGRISFEVLASGPDHLPTLIFEDNGSGLTEEEVHTFLSTVGQSSKVGSEAVARDFIGQFGIGLLSCFMVSEEIVLITRSCGPGAKTLEWRGRADGTYTLRALERSVAPGTKVFLRCKQGMEQYFDAEKAARWAWHYGALLPYPIVFSTGGRARCINEERPPWERQHETPEAEEAAWLEYGRSVFGLQFFDYLSLHTPAGEISGAAFVLAESPSLASRQPHRIYLKGMLLTERAENLLPEWAYFVRCVVAARGLKPTASRESLYEDETLQAARRDLGACLREYLIRLASKRPARFHEFLKLHYQSVKALASKDQDFYRTIIDWLPFQTSFGFVPLRELRQRTKLIHVVANHDEFRQVVPLAVAQSLYLVDGGFAYDSELMRQLPSAFPGLAVQFVSAMDLSRAFQKLGPQEEAETRALLSAASGVLRPLDCEAAIRKFSPATLPALYVVNEAAEFRRTVEKTRELSDSSHWGALLEQVAAGRDQPAAVLCLNYDSPLVRRVAGARDEALLRCGVQMLYIQALLMGHRQLKAKEMTLFSESLLALLDRQLGS